MQTGADVQAHVLQKAEADPQFRERLIADPKGVIEAETGLILPDDAVVLVEEAIANAQKEGAVAERPLTDDELLQVAGGTGDGWACIAQEGVECPPNGGPPPPDVTI